VIGGSDIVPTTPLSSELPQLFPIQAIADGISSDAAPYNGFAAMPESVGTIHLDLLGDFDITSFTLWNDINVFQEGIETFQLHFFDASDLLLASTAALEAPFAQLDPEVYQLTEVEEVSRVDIEVLSLNPSPVYGRRLEIREVQFEGVQVPTAVPSHPGSTTLSLGLNAPNPFDDSTTRIPFVLPSYGRTRVAVYNVAGTRVRVLVDQFRAPGTYSTVWDGRDDAGIEVHAGVYFCRLEHPSGVRSRRLVLVH
jgi:hypothetical protein